jgi:AraC-like DNA-binding protein
MPIQPKAFLFLGALVFCAGFALIALSPFSREVIFPAPGVEAQLVADGHSGGASTVQMVPGVSGLAFTYRLLPGAPYQFAGVKLLFNGNSGQGLDLRSASALQIQMKADSGIALRVALKSPAPELGRPKDPSAMVYHETEYEPWGKDTLHTVRVSDLRFPNWWRIREKRPEDQDLSRLSQVTEIEILNGFSQVPRESVRAEIQSIVALFPSKLAYATGGFLALAGLLLLGMGTYSQFAGSKRKAEMIPSTPISKMERPSLVGYRAVDLPNPDVALQEKVLAHLKEHYADPEYSLASLALGVGLSERNASETLHTATGTHLKGALNELRLQEAARLLQAKTHNVSEIAFAVGFNNPSHFTRAFKAKYGVAPSEFQGSTY